MDNNEKIRREQRMAEEMIRLHCEKRHGSRGALCADCAELLGYVRARCERCPHRPDKPFCSNCKTHCYRPAMREKIRAVMRFSGPRMLTRHPVWAIRHMLETMRERKKSV